MLQPKARKRLQWRWVVFLFGCIFWMVSFADGAGAGGPLQASEINNRINSVKYFSLVQDHIRDKFTNFLVSAEHQFESSGNPIGNPVNTTGFTWSGPDPDGWYKNVKIDKAGDGTVLSTTTIKFKSANVKDIRLKVTFTRSIGDGAQLTGTSDLSAVKGSDNLWNGVYYTSCDTSYDTALSSRQIYHLNLVERFTGAALDTGAGNYDVSAAFQVAGAPGYSLATSYAVNSSQAFTATGAEVLNPYPSDALSSEEINRRLNAVKKFNLVLCCMWDKFDNFLESGNNKDFVPSGGPIFVLPTPSFVWVPESDGWYIACNSESDNEGSEIRKVLRIKSSSPEEINLTAAVTEDCHDGYQRRGNYVLAVAKGENGWSGSLTGIGEDYIAEISQKCTWTFSETIQDAALDTGSGIYKDIAANISAPGRSIAITAGYAGTFDAVTQKFNLSGSQLFNGTANSNVNETYTIVGVSPRQINTMIYSIQKVGLLENYASDKFANFINGGTFTLGSNKTVPLWPYNLSWLWDSTWTLDTSNKSSFPRYTCTRNSNISGKAYTFKMTYWQDPDTQYHVFAFNLYSNNNNVLTMVGSFTLNAILVNDLWTGEVSFSDSGVKTIIQGAAIIFNITSFSASFSNADLTMGTGNYSHVTGTFDIPAQSKSYSLTSPADAASYYDVIYDRTNYRYSICGQDTFNGVTQTVNETYNP